MATCVEGETFKFLHRWLVVAMSVVSGNPWLVFSVH